MSTVDDLYLTKSFDHALEKLQWLQWLPWVGRDYEQTRFLVVGRNHHQLDGYNPDGERDFTRRVVREQGICERNATPFIRNLASILGGHDPAIWKAVAFHNLMLRCHPQPNDGFPTTSDWYNGKKVLDKLLCVLRPKFCLICLAEKRKILRHFSEYNAVNEEDLIGGVAPAVGRSTTHDTTIVFIREPSRVNVCEWRKFLLKSGCCRPFFDSLQNTVQKKPLMPS